MIDQNLCPECGSKMIPRRNGATGQHFWGCTNYPRCKGTRNTDGEAPRRHAVHTDREDSLPSDRQRQNDRQRWRNQ